MKSRRAQLFDAVVLGAVALAVIVVWQAGASVSTLIISGLAGVVVVGTITGAAQIQRGRRAGRSTEGARSRER